MSVDKTLDYINSLDFSQIEGVGYKPERHTGINPNWDCFIVVIAPFFLIDLIVKWQWVKDLEKSNETLYNIGGWVVGIALFICGLLLCFPYMKLRDTIFPPKEFVVYVGVDGKKCVIDRFVSKRRAIQLCEYMIEKWGFDHYQTEAVYN